MQPSTPFTRFPPSPSRSGRALPAATCAVASGGAIGAGLRWLVAATYNVAPGAWPWPTMFVNVVGCLLIGIALRRVERETLAWDAIVTGLLGGFTTMSAFAVELNDMVDLDRAGTALGYGTATLAAGIAAVALGSALTPPLTPPPAPPLTPPPAPPFTPPTPPPAPPLTPPPTPPPAPPRGGQEA